MTGSNLALIIVIIVIAYALPIGAAIVWCRRTHTSAVPVLIGAATFFVFASVLEGLLHRVCLAGDNAVARFLAGNVWYYGLYGAFAAGIFEETGRYLAFRTVLRRYTEKKNAIAYGIGHGGVEMILVLGVSYITLLAAALTNGAGSRAALLPSVGQITPGMAAVAVLERVSAMLFHISASVFVFIAAREKGKRWLWPVAIVLHAALDFPAVLYQAGILSLWGIETVIGVYSLVCACAALCVYRRYRASAAKDAPETLPA